VIHHDLRLNHLSKPVKVLAEDLCKNQFSQHTVSDNQDVCVAALSWYETVA
jgi:hypothetical protein